LRGAAPGRPPQSIHVGAGRHGAVWDDDRAIRVD